MEKQPHQEYRDELAGKLKEIRNSDPENIEIAKAKAQGYLDAHKESIENKHPHYYNAPIQYNHAKKDHINERVEKEKVEIAKQYITEVKEFIKNVEFQINTIPEEIKQRLELLKDKYYLEDGLENTEDFLNEVSNILSGVFDPNKFLSKHIIDFANKLNDNNLEKKELLQKLEDITLNHNVVVGLPTQVGGIRGSFPGSLVIRKIDEDLIYTDYSNLYIQSNFDSFIESKFLICKNLAEPIRSTKIKNEKYSYFINLDKNVEKTETDNEVE